MSFVVKQEGDSVRLKSLRDQIDGEVIIEFAPGVEVAFGRGSSDSDLTYIRLTQSDGSSVYLSSDDGQSLDIGDDTRPTG